MTVRSLEKENGQIFPKRIVCSVADVGTKVSFLDGQTQGGKTGLGVTGDIQGRHVLEGCRNESPLCIRGRQISDDLTEAETGEGIGSTLPDDVFRGKGVGILVNCILYGRPTTGIILLGSLVLCRVAVKGGGIRMFSSESEGYGTLTIKVRIV